MNALVEQQAPRLAVSGLQAELIQAGESKLHSKRVGRN